MYNIQLVNFKGEMDNSTAVAATLYTSLPVKDRAACHAAHWETFPHCYWGIVQPLGEQSCSSHEPKHGVTMLDSYSVPLRRNTVYSHRKTHAHTFRVPFF